MYRNARASKHQNGARGIGASALRATLASGVRRNIDATCWRRGGT
jgi:hypothetical protein